MALAEMSVVEQRHRPLLAVERGEPIVVAAQFGVSRQTLLSRLPRPASESIRKRRKDSDLLGRPVLAEAGDESALEDEDGDLSHSLADLLGQVVKLGFPFNDRCISIEVEIQQLALDTALRFDHLVLPVRPDPMSISNRFFEYPFMIRGCIREDGFDQVRVLFDPCPDVEVYDVADILFRKRHLILLHYRGQVQEHIIR